MKIKHYVLFFSMIVITMGCAAGFKSIVLIDESIRTDAKKIVMFPTCGLQSDDEMVKLSEKLFLGSFSWLSLIPGTQAARTLGVFDTTRAAWEKTMKTLIDDPSGLADSAFVEVLSRIGKKLGVDAVFVSVVQGSSGDYKAKGSIYFACGLFDLRDKNYRWIGKLEAAQGLAPLPFEAFVTRSIKDMSGNVQASEGYGMMEAVETSGDEIEKADDELDEDSALTQEEIDQEELTIQECKYKIKVIDEEYKQLSTVTIKVTRNDKELGRFYTNKNGKLNLKFVKLGNYTIKIWKKGFKAEYKNVELQEFYDQEIEVILSED